MKRVIIICTGILISICVIKAQYKPTTTWPYLYENFQAGTIYFDTNQKTEAQLNIHLFGNVLHYIKEDRIYEFSDKNVIRVEIGKDSYIYGYKKLMRIVSTNDTNLLLKLVTGDFDSLLSGSSASAYGARTDTHATQELFSLDLGGFDNPQHGILLQSKEDGRIVPLKTGYFFIIKDSMFPATAKEVERQVGEAGKEELKKFIKTNKIKWKDENKLIHVLNYLSVTQ